MRNSFIEFSSKSIYVLVLAAAAAMPLFFLSISSDFFAFWKFNLLIILTILGLFLWVAKMIAQKRFVYTRSPLDVGLIIFYGAIVLATLTSINRFRSLVGYTNNPWPSLLPTTILILLYFLVTENIKTEKQVKTIILAITASSAVAALFLIFSFFGYQIPTAVTSYREFTPAGSPYDIAMLASILVPVTIANLLFAKKTPFRAFYFIAASLLLISLIIVGFLPGFIPVVAGLIFILFVSLSTKISIISKILVTGLLGVLLITSLLRYTTLSANLLYPLLLKADKSQSIEANLTLDKSPILPQRAGWLIAASTLGRKPLLGTGPSTFSDIYTQLKPRFVNSEHYWNTPFAKSTTDFIEYFTTLGAIGIAAFILFVVLTARYLWRLLLKNKNASVYYPLATGIIASLVLMFVAPTTLLPAFVMILLLSSLVALTKHFNEKTTGEITVELATLRKNLGLLPKHNPKATTPKAKSQILPFVALALLMIGSFYVLRYQIKAIEAEYYFQQSQIALTRNDGRKTLDYLQKAIGANPHLDNYHRTLSGIALQSALSLNSRSTLSESEKNLIGQLAQLAIDQGKIATGYQILPLKVSGMAPQNVANWVTLANAYEKVIGVFPGADSNTLNTLGQALFLDPENPLHHDRLGLVLQRLNNLDDAQRKFEDAIIVKDDYGPAYYHLAKLLIEKAGDPEKIVSALTKAKEYLPKDPAIKDINKQLAIYTKKVEEQKKSDEANPTPTPTPSPEPTLSPSPSPTPEPSPSPTPEL